MKRDFAAKLRALVFDGPKRSKRIKSAAHGFSAAAATARGGRAHAVQMSQLPSFATSTANAYGMAERLHRYQDFCLAGDVAVALPGFKSFIRIDSLVERYQSGEPFSVFARVDGRTVIKNVTGARVTGTKRTLTVALDSGASIRCTSDHRFMLACGSYVEAGQLTPGVQLQGAKGSVAVTSVADSGLDELVYDIEVAGAGNFLLADVHPSRGVKPTVFVHNCEMETMPELAAALDIYADESVSSDEKGRVLTVYSSNVKIKETLEDLFFNVMNVEFNLRGWTRNLCKYGDAAIWLSIVADRGIDRVFPIPINEIEREEGYDPSDPLAYRFKWLTSARTYEPWEIAHFRLLGNDQFLPYGQSVIESSRRIWRQLVLMEDAMLTYRIVRAPERRVFYIDVGNTPPDEVPLLIEESKKNIRSNQVVEKTTGRADLRYNPLCNSLRTLIKLQDGRTISLRELIAEREAGRDDHWVYSVDLENKRLAPGRVVWAGVTMRDAQLCRVHLDDGTWRDCTPDHRFMLRDGSYCAASELTPGASLMPLYVKLTDESDERRAVRVEILAEREDVGDLTVERYHNFAAGHSPTDATCPDPGSYVFLHNSIEEDYWIPVRGSDTGTKIDTLQGGQNQAAIEDIQYLQRKLFAALKIPKAYLGFEEGLSSKATLSQEDIRFSRSIAVIQKTIISELNKIAMIHLFVRGFPEEALQDFYLTLSNPSTVAQQQKLELLRARAEIAGTFPEGFVDREWIRREVLDLEEAHVFQIDERRAKEKQIDAAVEAAGSGADSSDGGGTGGGGGGGGGSLFGDAPTAPDSDLGAGADGEPPAAASGEEDAELDLDVTASTDGEEELEAGATLLTSGDDRAQPKPGDQLDRALYNRSRHRTHGARRLVTPDHASMIQRSVTDDPFDSHWLSQRSKAAKLSESAARAPSDMLQMLKRARDAALAVHSEC